MDKVYLMSSWIFVFSVLSFDMPTQNWYLYARFEPQTLTLPHEIFSRTEENEKSPPEKFIPNNCLLNIIPQIFHSVENSFIQFLQTPLLFFPVSWVIRLLFQLTWKIPRKFPSFLHDDVSRVFVIDSVLLEDRFSYGYSFQNRGKSTWTNSNEVD